MHEMHILGRCFKPCNMIGVKYKFKNLKFFEEKGDSKLFDYLCKIKNREITKFLNGVKENIHI